MLNKRSIRVVDVAAAAKAAVTVITK